MPFTVLSDAPVSAKRDLLDFSRYYEPLMSVITSDTLETPFTLGIFGSWGSGKSTLLEILEEKLAQPHNGWKFVRVRFNPWMYRKEPNLLVPLLNSLHDALAESPLAQVKYSAAKLGDVLINLAADVLLKKITMGSVDLEKLEKLEKKYLDRRGQVDNQLRNLRTCLEGVARKLKDSNIRIVFFIDDLDRCDPAEMVDVLESMKLFLDVENMVHILALDKEVIDRGIEVKYGKFSFGQRQQELGAEYLEKMIQMPVYLFPLHKTQIRRFILALDRSASVTGQIELLVATLNPNPRKIKRVLNMLALTNSIVSSNPEQVFDWYVVTALAVIRVQQPGLYIEAARLPRLLVALEEVYAGERDVRDGNTFIDFKEKGESVRALCETYFRPTGMLAEVFKKEDRKFANVADKLETYLSVIGGL